ncbi:MAG: Hpt domain-containing protein [Candidatus Angelobacter sp.]
MNTEKQDISEPKREIIASALQLRDPVFDDLKSTGFDPDSLWNRVDEDLELLSDLMAVLAAEVPVMLSRIDAAITSGNTTELEKAGHKIKGSLLQFSASGAAAAAGHLEELGRVSTVAGAEALQRALKGEINLLMTKLTSMVNRIRSSRANRHKAGQGE